MGVYSDIIEQVKNLSVELSDKLSEIVDTESKYLDTILENIYNDVICIDEPDIRLIEHYYLELTNAVYFVGVKAEKFGILSDISKMKAKEVYNNNYISIASSPTVKEQKLTVAAITAQAEECSKYDTAVQTMYAIAYKILKFKIDTAQEMMRCLSKLISRRISEIDISKMDKSNEKQILLEEKLNG